MGYIFILLSAFCSLLIAHLLKVSEVKKLRTLNTLTVNYLVAGVVAGVWGWYQSENSTYVHEFLFYFFCLVVGVVFISNFIVYSKSVHANGVGVTVTAMRLSLLVPVLISVYIYNEYLNIMEIGGVILVFGALILLVPKKSTAKLGRMHAGWLLLVIFILSGFADASLKIYQEEFSLQINESLFMSLIFAGAFTVGAIASIFRSGPFVTKEEFKLGSLIGIPNLYSSVFLIFALNEISGSIAYPLVNMLTVAGGTALGVFRWGDSISKWQWMGLGMASIAIIILL